MPYIDQLARDRLEHHVAQTPGELNYILTLFIREYWLQGPQSYATINDIVGVLESAKAEFQRRIVAPYEDRKIKENGDVY